MTVNISYFDLNDEQVEAARLTLARNAKSPEDLLELLDMLGLLPQPPELTPEEIARQKAKEKAELRNERRRNREARRQAEINWLRRGGH